VESIDIILELRAVFWRSKELGPSHRRAFLHARLKPEVRSQEQEAGWHYGRPQAGRMNLLEEVSRLLNAYAKAILASDSWLLSRCFWQETQIDQTGTK
jgi:hypothetical protein